MNMKIGKQEVLILAVVILLIEIALFWFFGYRPAVSQVNALRQQQMEVSKKIQENNLTLQRLEEVRKESSKVEAEMVKILSNLPTKPELASFIILLNEIGEKCGVRIDSFKPQAPAQEGEYAKIPVDIVVTSYFNEIPENGGSLVEFLYRIEKLPRITNIESLNISRQSDKEGKLTATIKLNTFSLISTVKPATPTTPAASNQTTQTAQNTGTQ